MSTSTMSQAQLAQQHTRDGGGRYSELARAEDDMFLPPPPPLAVAAAAVPGPGPDGVWNEKDLETVPGAHWLSDEELVRAQAKLDVLNGRLSRAGSAEGFVADISKAVVRDGDGELYETNLVHLQRPRLRVGEWSFAAVVTSAGGDGDAVITQPIPGMDDALGGWRATDAQRCDHCGQSRHRRKTFVLVSPDGGRMQVGSTCLQPFAGMDADLSLAWMQFDLDDFREPSTSGGASGDPVVSVTESIGLALAFSDGGKRFISGAKAEMAGGMSTAAHVRGLRMLKAPDQSRIRESAGRFIADGTVAAVIAEAQSLAGDSDYAQNLRALTGQGHVSSRHLGTVVSAIICHQQRVEREARPAPAKGWLAPKGTKLKGMGVRAKVVTALGGSSFYGGREKPTTMLILETADGHALKWNASKWLPQNVGDEVIIDGGTVSDHSSYQGRDQTVLQRVKLSPAVPVEG